MFEKTARRVRMRRPLPVLAALAACGAASVTPARADTVPDAAPVPAATPADVQQSVQGLWDKADAAFYLRDLSGVFAAYAPDFLSVDGTQRSGLDKPKHLAQYLLSACSSVQRRSHVETAVLDDKAGDTATVTVSHTFQGQSDNPQTQQSDAIEIDSTDRDFWVRMGGAWVLKREKNLTSRTTVNGQPIVGVLDDLPATPTEYNLSGVWAALSQTSGYYVVRINQFSNRLVSTKMTGTDDVPAGYVNFYATYTGDAFPCKRQIAGPDHTDVRWVAAQVMLADGDDFTVSDSVYGTTVYKRVKQ